MNLKERATRKLVRELTATGIPVSEKINNLAPVNLIKRFGVEQDIYKMELTQNNLQAY